MCAELSAIRNAGGVLMGGDQIREIAHSTSWTCTPFGADSLFDKNAIVKLHYAHDEWVRKPLTLSSGTAVVAIQSAYRAKLARRKAFLMKIQKMLDQQVDHLTNTFQRAIEGVT